MYLIYTPEPVLAWRIEESILAIKKASERARKLGHNLEVRLNSRIIPYYCPLTLYNIHECMSDNCSLSIYADRVIYELDDGTYYLAKDRFTDPELVNGEMGEYIA
jgi:hypothetical protein